MVRTVAAVGGSVVVGGALAVGGAVALYKTTSSHDILATQLVIILVIPSSIVDVAMLAQNRVNVSTNANLQK